MMMMMACVRALSLASSPCMCLLVAFACLRRGDGGLFNFYYLTLGDKINLEKIGAQLGSFVI
jgi:hypothetical protein